MLGVFLDTETNGLNWIKHRIIEIALHIVDLTTGEEKAHYHSLVLITPEEWTESSKNSLKFTGITFEELEEHGKPAILVQKELITLFKKHHIKRGCALFICQNPTFDRIFLSHLIPVELQERLLLPYYWLDLASMYWAKQYDTGTPLEKISLSKDRIAATYNIPPEPLPHRAARGAAHLLACYNALIRA